MNNRTTPAAPRPSAPGITVPLVLAIALLLPVAVLFTQVWRDVDADRSAAAQERDGVAYLRALWPLTSVLADAQSAAVTGQPVPRKSLDRAVTETEAADARWGAELRTRDRWRSLRSKIDALPDRPANGVPDTISKYQEVTDLLLALYAKAADGSGLTRDPAADSAKLQDVSARQMPAALIATGRLADVAATTSARSAAEQLNAIGELTAARLSTFGPAMTAVADLQEAIDVTQSTSLGGNVLSRLDTYQRALDVLGSTVALPGEAGGAADATAGADRNDGTDKSAGAEAGGGPLQGVLPDRAKVASAREATQRAAADLGTIILTELDTLIRDRVDRTDGRRLLAACAATLAILLSLSAVVVAVLSTRRRIARERIAFVAAAAGFIDAPAGDRGRPAPTEPAPGPLPGDQRRWQALELTEPVAVGSGPNARPAPPTPGVRDNQPTRWGRTDAAR